MRYTETPTGIPEECNDVITEARNSDDALLSSVPAFSQACLRTILAYPEVTPDDHVLTDADRDNVIDWLMEWWDRDNWDKWGGDPNKNRNLTVQWLNTHWTNSGLTGKTIGEAAERDESPGIEPAIDASGFQVVFDGLAFFLNPANFLAFLALLVGGGLVLFGARGLF